MIEYYETVEGCSTRQPVQHVFVSVPALPLYGMQLSNVCTSELNSNTNSSRKQLTIWIWGQDKKLSNWLRSHHSHDLKQIQLEVAGEVLLYTADLFHLEFLYLFKPKGHFGQIQYFFKVLKTNFEFNTFLILSIPHGNPENSKSSSCGKPKETSVIECSSCEQWLPYCCAGVSAGDDVVEFESVSFCCSQCLSADR